MKAPAVLTEGKNPRTIFERLPGLWNAYTRSQTLCTGLFPHLVYGLSTAVVGAIQLWPLIRSTAAYSDFVAGPAAFAASNPSKNSIVLLSIIPIAICVALMFQLLTFILERRSGSDVVAGVKKIFWLACLPEAIFVGLHICRSDISISFLIIGIAVKLFVAAALVTLVPFGLQLSANAAQRLLGRSVLAMLLAPMVALSLLTVVSRFDPMRLDGLSGLPFWVTVTAVVSLLLLLMLSRDIATAERRQTLFLFGLQAAIPPLILVLTPCNWLLDGKSHSGFPTRGSLVAALVLFFVATYSQLWRRLTAFLRSQRLSTLAKSRKSSQPESSATPIERILIPLGMASILIFAQSQPFFGPGLVSADDYHNGEEILPYEQFHLFGSVPYADLNSPRGLRPFVAGFINEHFFGGQLDTRSCADGILQAGSVTLLFLGARLVLGTPLAFLFTYLFIPSLDYLLLVSAALFLLLHTLAKASFDRSLQSLVWVALLITPYNVPTGAPLAIAGALGLLAAYGPGSIREAVASRPRLTSWRRSWPIVSAALVLLLLYRMYFGLARFLYETASTNTLANALESQFDTAMQSRGLLGSPLAFEVCRFLLVGGVIACIATVVSILRSDAAHHIRRQLVFLLVSIAVFLLLTMPYSLGRIQGNDPGRPGEFSLWVIAAVLPLYLVLSGRLGSGSSYCIVTIVMSAAWGAGFPADPPDWHWLKTKATYLIPVNEADLKQAEPAFGLGTSRLEPANKNTLELLQAALARYLRPGETYFDLTNHSARYYYLGYKVPVVEAAVYNAAAPATQRRMVKQLTENRPPVVLIDAFNIYHDGGRASVRTSILYRYVLSKYTPIRDGPFTLLVEPSRAAQPSTAVEASADVRAFQPCNLTDQFWKNGISTISGRAGFTDCNGSSVFGLRRGDSVILAKSGQRTIENANGDQIWLSGDALDPDGDGFPNEIRPVRRVHGDNSFVPCNVNDRNWSHGISIMPGRFGFTDCDGRSVAGLAKGDTVVLAHSARRLVEGVNQDQVWVSGPALDPIGDGFPQPIAIESTGRKLVDPKMDLQLGLLEKAFFNEDLAKLPIAWGLSTQALEKRLRLSRSLSPARLEDLRQCIRTQEGSLQPQADVISFSVDLDPIHISGAQASILKMETDLSASAAYDSSMQVFWTSDLTFGREVPHVSFRFDRGILLIPLDTNPRFFMSKQIHRLRFEIRAARQFQQIRIGRLSFYNRED